MSLSTDLSGTQSRKDKRKATIYKLLEAYVPLKRMKNKTAAEIIAVSGMKELIKGYAVQQKRDRAKIKTLGLALSEEAKRQIKRQSVVKKLVKTKLNPNTIDTTKTGLKSIAAIILKSPNPIAALDERIAAVQLTQSDASKKEQRTLRREITYIRKAKKLLAEVG